MKFDNMYEYKYRPIPNSKNKIMHKDNTEILLSIKKNISNKCTKTFMFVKKNVVKVILLR